METFYNIEEQRKWNDESMWSADGHEWSGFFNGTDKLWNEHIFNKIKIFRNKKILEIAPGFGRMSQYLSILASELVVVDLNQTCIDKTREKLGGHVSAYYVNDGKSLSMIKDSSQDLVFSFDSFVHMHQNVVEEYVKEINRVLKPGGYGFVHHSWFYGGEEYSFNNISGRANMLPEIFKDFVDSNNMEIVSQESITFPEVTDCISFFRKK